MERPKKHFLFNLEWDEILSELPKEVKYEVYDAIIEYAKSGKLLDLKPIAKGCFLFIKKELDYYKNQYQNTIDARREAGSKGGKAKQNKQKVANATLAKQTKQSQANSSLYEYDNKYDNDIITPIPPKGDNGSGGWREELMEKFFSKQIALESFCKNNQTNPEDLRRFMQEIFDEWELINETDRSERHLVNTLRIKIKISYGNDQRKPESKSAFNRGGMHSKLPPEPDYGLIED